MSNSKVKSKKTYVRVSYTMFTKWLELLEKGEADKLKKEFISKRSKTKAPKSKVTKEIVDTTEYKDPKILATEFRDKLIKNQTEAEKVFKILLKDVGLEYKFQEIIFIENSVQFYIVDFYLPALNIVIEVDGKYHNAKEQKKLDKLRTKALRANNIVEVIRFTNEAVLKDHQYIKDRLKALEYYKAKQADEIKINGRRYKKRLSGKQKAHIVRVLNPR